MDVLDEKWSGVMSVTAMHTKENNRASNRTTDDYFSELKEWSARKHNLLRKYLTGFARILGGTRGTVYYIDGFAGPGIYEDKAKGSPVLAAEYAQELREKDYALYCINIEPVEEWFKNLEENTRPYSSVVTNLRRTLAENIDQILEKIGHWPALFFLDPFGIRGVEWATLYGILRRPDTTELLLRVDPKTISRLAGFYDSTSRRAAAKVQRLNEWYGSDDAQRWHQVWLAEASGGMVDLYLRRLVDGIDIGSGAFACAYEIKEIGGAVKYYLAFATRHPKGVILMNDIIYGMEETYQREVEEFQARQPLQLSLFDVGGPTPEEIFAHKVKRLKEDIWQELQGRTASRINIRAAMLRPWFGKVKGSHFTRALKELEEAGQIVERSGKRSQDYTRFTFQSASSA